MKNSDVNVAGTSNEAQRNEANHLAVIANFPNERALSLFQISFASISNISRYEWSKYNFLRKGVRRCIFKHL